MEKTKKRENANNKMKKRRRNTCKKKKKTHDTCEISEDFHGKSLTISRDCRGCCSFFGENIDDFNVCFRNVSCFSSKRKSTTHFAVPPFLQEK